MSKKLKWYWISIAMDIMDAIERFRRYIESPDHSYRAIVMQAVLASIASVITSVVIWAYRN